jgi:hypothetical protein
MKIIKDTNEEKYKNEEEYIINNEFYKLTNDDISRLETIAKEVKEQKNERELSIRKEEERRNKIKIKLGFFRSIGEKVSNTFSQLSETFRGRPRSALATRHQSALPTRPQSALPTRPQSALPTRPQSALGRKTSFALGQHRKSEKDEVKEQEHILSSNVEEKNSNKTHDQIISEFDTVFLKILTQVNNNRKNGGSKPFKSIMMLVNNLPDIDTTLPALVDRELNTLEKRYKKILELVKKKCSGWRGTICSSAASLLGNETYQIYIHLKNNTNEENISTEKLIDFIIDVLPIMMSKLQGVNEFKELHKELNEINNDLGLPVQAVGGKKSSRATHKEIQGRLMKIYRKPNDKKDYVKHKGVLISTKEYKEHMKQRAVITKKVILGKERCIYKVQGSKKEHVKYKGSLIPVADYKKLMKV